MRHISWALTPLLMMAGLDWSVWEANAGDRLRAQDLVGLSQEELVAVMKSFLERRMDKVRNIEVMAETKFDLREDLNGRLGKRVAHCNSRDFHIMHCDGSYRVKSSFYAAEDAKAPDSVAESHYDEKTGIIRATSHQSNRKEHEGRIGRKHLPSMISNRLPLYLLSGSYLLSGALDKPDFLLQSLYECSDKWQVDVNVREQQVAIIHPYRISFFDTGVGRRKVYFDVTKGMMPARMELDFRDDEGRRRTKPFWQEDRVVMNEAKDFGGFWMPMRIEERRRCSVPPPNTCSIMLTNVKQVVFGRVKKEDLEVKFPENTLVADTIKNVFYRTGLDGEPTGPINPIGIPEIPLPLDEHGQLIQRPSWILRVGLWSLGIGIALLFCLILLKRIRARIVH